MLPALRCHLDRHGPNRVEIIPGDLGFFGARRPPPDHPLGKFVASLLDETSGKAPHLLPYHGDSLPNEVFSDVLGRPVVWCPILIEAARNTRRLSTS